MVGAITSYIDVAQVALYVFWGFFFGLIFYLRREDKREGYPLVTDRPPFGRIQGFPRMPRPKTFLLPNGGSVIAPRTDDHPEPAFDAVPTGLWPGAPWQPVGDPLLAGVGPNAAVMRADEPDMTYPDADHGSLPRVVPMRVANDHFPDPDGVDVRGMPVIAADGVVAGTVSDLWIDRSETVVRYLQVNLTEGGTVLLPLPLARVDLDGKVQVSSVLAAQFAEAPRIANPNQVTLREEDKIQAFFASGHLFATPNRMEPLI